MSLKRRNGIYHVDYTSPSGSRIRRSTGTRNRQEAQEIYAQLKSEAWRVHKLGEKPRHTFGEAILRWVREKEGVKKTLDDDRGHLAFLRPYLAGTYLDQLDRDAIDRVTTAKLETGVKNATVNRMLEVLRAVLSAARDEWEWVDKVPKVRLLPEPKGRVRFLTHAEAASLITELPAHLCQIARFALATGLRQSNITRLRWSQVNFEARSLRIAGDEMKNGQHFGIPLSAEAVVVLREQSAAGQSEYVFTYMGNPVTQVSTKAWRSALKRAGIEDFRFHDLRHTWASWHVQRGTPLQVLKELGGWESMEMVMRYAHLNQDALGKHATNLNVPTLRVIDGTKMAQATG